MFWFKKRGDLEEKQVLKIVVGVVVAHLLYITARSESVVCCCSKLEHFGGSCCSMPK
jgi:hypothetical protein